MQIDVPEEVNSSVNVVTSAHLQPARAALRWTADSRFLAAENGWIERRLLEDRHDFNKAEYFRKATVRQRSIEEVGEVWNELLDELLHKPRRNWIQTARYRRRVSDDQLIEWIHLEDGHGIPCIQV